MSKYLLFLVFSSALSAAISNACLRFALNGKLLWKGNMEALILDILVLLKSPILLVGLIFFGAANALWLIVLSSQKLSLAYPVQLGLVLAFNGLLSVFVFEEALSVWGWIGVMLIGIGVIMVAK